MATNGQGGHLYRFAFVGFPRYVVRTATPFKRQGLRLYGPAPLSLARLLNLLHISEE
jgi:hypothetical protein